MAGQMAVHTHQISRDRYEYTLNKVVSNSIIIADEKKPAHIEQAIHQRESIRMTQIIISTGVIIHETTV